MKRQTYILIALLLFGFKSGNNFTGRFYNHTAYDKIEYFDFKSNGRFEYYAECEYKKYGYGNYQLKNDKLILEYLTREDKEKAHFDIWGYKIANQYSDTIYLRIQDLKSKKKIDSVVLHYRNSDIATITKNVGETKMIRYDSDLIISKIGYRDLIIPKEKINNKGILGFNIFMQDWSIEFIEEITDTINVNLIHNDTLIMDNSIFLKNIKPSKIINCE
jgi:hypothetical protein